MPGCLVAIDFGTGAVRSVVFDPHGVQLGEAYREISYDAVPQGPPGACDFSGQRMWRVIGRAVQGSLRDAGVRPDDVLAATATSQRHGIALVGRRGETLYAGPNRDSRGVAVFNPGEDAAAYPINGRWPLPILAPYRLKWFRRHQPHVLERASAMLMLNDWVVFQLCGEAACADSGAAESLLFDIKALDWSPRLAEHFGVPRSLLPSIVRGGDLVGRVTARAAKVTGLRQGTPVVAAGGDTQCAVLGLGGITPGDVAVVAGTTAPVQSVTDSPALDPAGRTWTGVHVPAGRWVHESNAGAAGILLRWFRDTFGPAARSRRAKAEAYEALFGLAANVPPGADGLQAVMGSSPMDPQRAYTRIRAFVFAPDGPAQFEAAVGRAHFARALMESIVYAIKANFDQLPEVSAAEPRQVALCGGCARSAVFVDLLANVLDRPVAMARAQEVTALGAAICAAVGAGVYRSIDEAVGSMTELRVAATPLAETARRYRELYERWTGVRDAVIDWG